MEAFVTGITSSLKRRRSLSSLSFTGIRRSPSIKRQNSVKESTLKRQSSKEPKLKRQFSVPAFRRSHVYHPTLGEDLDVVKQDHLVKTHPANNHNRRTLVLKRENESWGFTLQSYGVHHKSQGAVEHMTYVDYVELGSPADLSGMRKGDIILSINGQSMEDTDHNKMVKFIQTCGQTLRMVVLFEDCSHKVEMHLRYMKLKKLLAAKEFELNSINDKISRLHNGQKLDAPRQTSSVSCDNTLSQDDDRMTLTHEVQAVATLPRRPKGQGFRGKIGNFSFYQNKNSSSTSSFETHSLPRSKSASQSQTDSGTFPENIPTSQEPSCISCCPGEANGDSSQKVVCKPIRNRNSDSCITMNVSPYVTTTGDLMAPAQYNSLPVRGKKKRPASLMVPQITITPPTLTRGGSYQDVTSPTMSLGSFSSFSSQSSVFGSVQSNGVDSDATSSESVGTVSECGTSQVKSVLSRHVRSRNSLRSRSFRASNRQSISLTSGESYEGSSNHVLTERNCRIRSDPELLHLKQGDLDLHCPEQPEIRHHVTLLRSLSSPAMKIKSVLNEKRRKMIAGKRSPDANIAAELANQVHSGNECGRKNPGLAMGSDENKSLENVKPYGQSVGVCEGVLHNYSPICNGIHESVPVTNYSHIHSNENGNHSNKNNGCHEEDSCHGNHSCENQTIPGVCFVHHPNNLAPSDGDGNYNQPEPERFLIDQLRELSVATDCEQINTSDNMLLVVPHKVKSRPSSTGSDITIESRSLSRSSSVTSDISNRSSGSFEYHTDPFTPSPEDQRVPEFIQKPTETPIQSNVPKRLTRRALNYSRHKDVLMNINEEDEITKL